MEKVRYMISDAANLVNVESHVLRYWEEELELDIPRNEMGHRYYTQENIEEFQRIKDLKEQGYQLKAIRMIVHNGDKDHGVSELTGNTAGQSMEHTEPSSVLFRSPYIVQTKEASKSILDTTERMAQFAEHMTEIVGKAIAANNAALSKNISEDVGEQVIKEMNYLMREQEDAEEERFRKLDEAIRGSFHKKNKEKKFFKKKS